MNRPLRLAECFVGVCGMFATHFVGGRCIINNPFAMFWQTTSSCRGRFIVPAYTYSQQHCTPFEMPSRNVRNVLVICMLHIRYAKVWFLRHKSMVFGVQKGSFYIAKTPFLKCEIPDNEHGTTKCGIIYKVYCHCILMLNLVETRCSGIMVWCAFWFLVVANILQSGV